MNSPSRPGSQPTTPDPTRWFVLFLTVACGGGAVALRFWPGQETLGDGSMPRVIATGLGRFALVMAALWLAWPVARKPAMWLPPGLAVLALVVLGVCVVHPRAAIALVPLFGALLAFSAVVKFFRSA